LLSDHADTVMARVEPDDRGREGTRVTEDLFRALTHINADGQATRYPRRLKELIAITGADEGSVRRVVDAFRVEGVSFMRPYGTDAIDLDDYVDISHEALMRCWARVADPTDGWLSREFKNGLVWRSLVVQADSFETDASNVLSPATAEERHRWLKRRNEAWSLRYGGRWASVVRLVEASVAARERRIQEEVEARAREEQVKLREEQGRLKEQTLKSELAIAVEKARGAKVFRSALAISLVLLGLAVFWGVQAYFDRVAAQRSAADARAAERSTRRAADAADHARDQERDERRKLQQTTDLIARELESLKTAAAQSPANAALKQRIDDVGSAINGVAVVPRVYMHIVDESQRSAARDLQRRIELARVGDYAIVVPGIQRVAGAPAHAVLRCFVAAECATYGQALLDVVNGQLAEPKLVLQDFSGTYTPDGSIRALHFEIYFPKGSIRPAPAGAKSAY
jgi:hypothetical protein